MRLSAIGAHKTLVRPAIAELTVRSAIGAHRIVSAAMEGLVVSAAMVGHTNIL